MNVNFLFLSKSLPKYIKSLAQETEEQDSSPTEATEAIVLELDPATEDAACQLWDMTVEKAVVAHILKLEEANLLHIAELTFRESLSPRLTVSVFFIPNYYIVKKNFY